MVGRTRPAHIPRIGCRLATACSGSAAYPAAANVTEGGPAVSTSRAPSANARCARYRTFTHDMTLVRPFSHRYAISDTPRAVKHGCSQREPRSRHPSRLFMHTPAACAPLRPPATHIPGPRFWPGQGAPLLKVSSSQRDPPPGNIQGVETGTSSK